MVGCSGTETGAGLDAGFGDSPPSWCLTGRERLPPKRAAGLWPGCGPWSLNGGPPKASLYTCLCEVGFSIAVAGVRAGPRGDVVMPVEHDVTEAAGVAAGVVSDEVVEAVVSDAAAGGVDLLGPDGVLAELTKRILERALAEEMTDHLGYESGDPIGHGTGNNRNGTSPKQVLTEIGAVDLDIPGTVTPRSNPGSFPRAPGAWNASTPTSWPCTPGACPPVISVWNQNACTALMCRRRWCPRSPTGS